jgi:hypothetical protein
MSIFDLLFIVVFLASLLTLLTASVLALRKQGSRALRTLRNFAICFAIYVTIVCVVALTTPQRVYAVGEDRCFDDWCIAVEDSVRAPAPGGILYTVTLRLSSHAGRASQREKGVRVYLTDALGRRFDPNPDPSATPFDVLLAPGQTVQSKRAFLVPPDAHDVGLALSHEGPGWLIIGDDGNPLHKHAVMRLP